MTSPMSSLPRLYTASKVYLAPMWRSLRRRYRHDFHFISTWINEDISPLDDADEQKCRDGWTRNIEESADCDVLICAALPGHELSGTLVEIGSALGSDRAAVFLVGECERFATWRHHPRVTHLPSTNDPLPVQVRKAFDLLIKRNLP